MGETATITIDSMLREDLDQVLAIEEASFTMPWSRNLFLSEFRNPNVSLMLVARTQVAQREIVGYIVCWRVVDELHILDLATLPSRRRKGIARQLVLAALREGCRSGVRRAFLEVRASNSAAFALYESLGFVRSQVREGYYDKPIEDAVVMSLEKKGLEELFREGGLETGL
ncbi:MAG: ribosomal protein S18-alanine N-acetyltransferase [Nitrospirota bacterium]